jgi:acetyltransferase
MGVVRLHSDANFESGEYAILVRSDLKGRGLGWQLMQLIVEYARSEGLQRIEGQVLRENTTMLDMCRELGFVIGNDLEDLDLRHVRLALRYRSCRFARNGSPEFPARLILISIKAANR